MRKLLILVFAVLLIAGCVSNRKFQAERERVGRMEFQQMKNTDELSNLRADYEMTNENLEALISTLESELNLLKEDLISLNDGVNEVRNEMADYAERSDTMMMNTTDRVTSLETGMQALDTQVTGIEEAREAQLAEFNRFKDSYEATTTFNEDVLISFDQRLAELNEQLATIDTKYEAYAQDYATRIENTQEMITTIESGISSERSRLENLQETHTAAQEETEGMIMGTVERIEAIERRLAAEHATVGELISIVGELEGNIDNLQELVREVSNSTINSVELSLMESREDTNRQLADMDNRLEAMRAQLAEVRNDMGGEIVTVQRNVSEVANELTVVANDLEAVTSRNARGPARTDRAINSYNNAKAYYDRHNYEEAIVRLEAFLAAYPDHDYAANARYWIAESYYAGRNFTKALRGFEDVISHHPQHAKALDAEIKKALCYARMDDPARAASMLNSFKERHPDYHNMALVNRLLRGLN